MFSAHGSSGGMNPCRLFQHWSEETRLSALVYLTGRVDQRSWDLSQNFEIIESKNCLWDAKWQRSDQAVSNLAIDKSQTTRF
jgi:hypothetical protein